MKHGWRSTWLCFVSLFLTHSTICFSRLPGSTDNISQREILRHKLFPSGTLARKYQSIFSIQGCLTSSWSSYHSSRPPPIMNMVGFYRMIESFSWSQSWWAFKVEGKQVFKRWFTKRLVMFKEEWEFECARVFVKSQGYRWWNKK